MIEKYALRKPFIKPQFSYKILNISTPTWAINPPTINLELNDGAKQVTPPAWYMQQYRKLVQTRYNDHEKLFTDGLKRKERVASAVVWNVGSRSASLPREALIYSAEAHAISMAVRAVHVMEGEQFVIMSDSGSVLRTLLEVKNDHPVSVK